MRTNWFKRIGIGLCGALLLGLATAVAGQARAPQDDIQGSECGNCHAAIYAEWENSAHSQVTALPGALAWDDTLMGQVAAPDSACLVCHPTDPTGHPQRIMHTDSSSQQCGNCHENTFMEWEDSAHGQIEVACASCHNPHSRQLRTGGVAEACRSCHKNETHFYTFTQHATEGLVCTDCHMQMVEDTNINQEIRRMHTLIAGKDSCNGCHAQGMHYPNQQTTTQPANPPLMPVAFHPPSGDADEGKLESQPLPGSSLNFIILAAVIGMLFGVAGSTWLERKFRS